MENFIYPNEAIVEWDLLIVIYPFITGLVAGAFIISSLYHVFGIQKLKPVARFSLITALAFLLVAPIPLTVHLGRPERALEMFLRPNFMSAMAGFGYIWMGYLILLLVEVWLVFRFDIVKYAKSSHGFKKTIYSALSLGIHDLSEKAVAGNEKLIKILAAIGVPMACLLHGYVGFIFGAIKANPWWSTPLMPIIFLISAIVSGIALLVVLYIVVMKLRHRSPDYESVHSLALWLGGFLTVALVIEGLELITRVYESEESWGIISQLITQKLAVSYFGIQYIMGMFLPLLILGIVELANFGHRVKTSLRLLSSGLILVGVFAMRWNVVLGGQLVSKSLRGFSTYSIPIGGENGLIAAVIILILPLVILSVLTYVIPPWHEEIKVPEHDRYAYYKVRFK